MGQKITLVARDECGRGRAEVTVERTLRYCAALDRDRRFYTILQTWGCDFGDRSGFLQLPIGKCDGVVAGAYAWQEVPK
jgi:hypothetical protein